MYRLLYSLSTFLNTEKMGTTEYCIARSMLEHIKDIPDCSIGEMAERCNVSKSKLSKFVRKIGFEDYIDFKWSSELEAGRMHYTDNQTTVNITDYICSNNTNRYLEVLFKDIRMLFENANISKLDTVAKYIHDYKKVAAFGRGYSESAAINLSFKMSFYHKYVYTTLDAQEQTKYLKQVDEETVLIIFSNLGGYLTDFSGLEGIEKKESLRRTRAKIVLITSNESMRNYPNVDTCICVNYSEKVQNHPVMYQLIVEQIALRYQQIYGLPDEK